MVEPDVQVPKSQSLSCPMKMTTDDRGSIFSSFSSDKIHFWPKCFFGLDVFLPELKQISALPSLVLPSVILLLFVKKFLY